MTTTCTARHHGDTSAYSKFGCRCPDAVEAQRLYAKRGKHGYRQPALVDSTGTARRLRALAAIGWGVEALGERLGPSKSRVGNCRIQHRATIARRSAAAVARVYDELSMVPGPCSKARAHALKQGWPPPLAWDDDRIDDPKARPRGAIWRAPRRSERQEAA